MGLVACGLGAPAADMPVSLPAKQRPFHGPPECGAAEMRRDARVSSPGCPHHPPGLRPHWPVSLVEATRRGAFQRGTGGTTPTPSATTASCVVRRMKTSLGRGREGVIGVHRPGVRVQPPPRSGVGKGGASPWAIDAPLAPLPPDRVAAAAGVRGDTVRRSEVGRASLGRRAVGGSRAAVKHGWKKSVAVIEARTSQRRDGGREAYRHVAAPPRRRANWRQRWSTRRLHRSSSLETGSTTTERRQPRVEYACYFRQVCGSRSKKVI